VVFYFTTKSQHTKYKNETILLELQKRDNVIGIIIIKKMIHHKNNDSTC